MMCNDFYMQFVTVYTCEVTRYFLSFYITSPEWLQLRKTKINTSLSYESQERRQFSKKVDYLHIYNKDNIQIILRVSILSI